MEKIPSGGSAMKVSVVQMNMRSLAGKENYDPA